VGFGSNGEGYVRIGLVENDQRIRQAGRNIKQFLIDLRNENLDKSPQRSPEIS
jgi:alanine-synthesizing transaminase